MRHHEALPVIVAPTHQALWLNRVVADKVSDYGLSQLYAPSSDQSLTYPISPWVNSPRHDDELCMEPAGDM